MDHGMSRAKSPRGDLIYIAPNVESSEAFVRFDSKPVVHGDWKLLFAPEVPLRGLDGHMPQQELNLIQFATCKMAHAPPVTSSPNCGRCRSSQKRVVLPTAMLAFLI